MPVSDLAANAANNAVGALALYAGALKATSLTAQANSGQAHAILLNPVAAGDALGFDLGASPSEIRTVLSVTGSGPYDALLDSNLSNTYASGKRVAHAPKEGSTVREPSGGSPTYARKPMTWNASVSRDLDSLNVPVIDIPASTDVGGVGWFDAVSGGNFIFSGLSAAIQTFSAQGTYQVNDADLIAG